MGNWEREVLLEANDARSRRQAGLHLARVAGGMPARGATGTRQADDDVRAYDWLRWPRAALIVVLVFVLLVALGVPISLGRR
jgi:hypothetical protein